MPKRTDPTSPVYRWPWPKVRVQILNRDGHLCQIRGDGCTERATAVDHIVPVTAGGAWYDPANLRAACVSCNNRRRAKAARIPPTTSRAW